MWLWFFRRPWNKRGLRQRYINNGARALERLDEAIPDLVLLDLHLPGASGEQVLKYIRSDSRLENINVIVTTADSNWAEKLSSESTISMLKPISFTQLRQIAEQLKSHDK